jgi:biopolymer transport protein ExbD
LIKNLGNFKQMVAVPLSPRKNSSSEKKSIVVCLRGSRSFILNRKIKNKSHAPTFKVVHDMLMKKWIFIKKDKQLSVWSEVVRLLEALRLPP